MKYATTSNVLSLALDTNPTKIKRFYGKIYLTAGGKTTVQNFDSKTGMVPQLPM